MFELLHLKKWRVACGRNGWIELFFFKMHKTKVDANKPEICFGAFSWNECATQALGLPDNKITSLLTIKLFILFFQVNFMLDLIG